MLLFKLLAPLCLLLASASGQTLTGPTQCLTSGQYLLCQNLWGRSSGTGSQTSTLISNSGGSISWSTNYTWANGANSVKSYANVESTNAKGVQLRNVTSAPTTWNWAYTSQASGLRANVAYDVWLGVPSVGTPASNASSYELMIWVSRLGGVQPLGSQVASNVAIGGRTWNVWRGPNANWQVISFVNTQGELPNFSANLKDFFNYVVASQGVAATQYVQSIQAGTEPFTGTANLRTNSYSVSIAT